AGQAPRLPRFCIASPQGSSVGVTGERRPAQTRGRASNGVPGPTFDMKRALEAWPTVLGQTASNHDRKLTGPPNDTPELPLTWACSQSRGSLGVHGQFSGGYFESKV